MRNNFAPRDYGQRLDASVCRYEGFPVYVRTINEREFHLYKLDELSGAVWKTINPQDPNFDVASLPLGYIQWKNEVYYTTRRPLRKFKQGIDEKSLLFSPLPGVASSSRAIAPRSLLYSREFVDMVTENYPSLERALTSLAKKDGSGSLAISRHIALHINDVKVVHVFFKNEMVGWIAPGDRTVHVPSNPMGAVVSMHLRGFNWIID